MNEKVTRFYEAVSADDALQSELTAVTEGVVFEDVSEEEARQAMADAVAAFAAEHDLDLTAEDVLGADEEARREEELSEDELEAVAAGGAHCVCAVIGMLKGCGCAICGTGKGDDAMDGTFGGNCALVGY